MEFCSHHNLRSTDNERETRRRERLSAEGRGFCGAEIGPQSLERERKRGVCVGKFFRVCVCVCVCVCGGGNIKPALPQHTQGRGPFFKPSLPTMHWALLSRQWKDEARWMTKGKNGDLGWARLGRQGRERSERERERERERGRGGFRKQTFY